MRHCVRSLMVAVLTVVAVVALTVAWTMSTAVQVTATALFVGSTFYPIPQPSYMVRMSQSYLEPFHPKPDAYVSVHTPAQFWPYRETDEYTLDESVRLGAASLKASIAGQPVGRPLLVNGYSQGTRVASIVKQDIIARHGENFESYPDIGFILVSNINKPNGGVISRGAILGSLSPITVPYLGITFGDPTPTNSPVNPDDPDDHALDTKDITVLYDGVSDAPVYLNPLTLANGILGFFQLHNYEPLQPELVYQGSNGDSDYYIHVPDLVPILRPLADQGVPRPVLLFLDEPLRVLIEATGYRRDVNPGEPTPFGLFPVLNPVLLAANLALSVAVGLDDAFEDMGNGRPLGTVPSGPYGVGGPALPAPPPVAEPAQDEYVWLGGTADQSAPQPSAQQPDPVADLSGATTSPADAATSGADEPATADVQPRAQATDSSPAEPMAGGPIDSDPPPIHEPRRSDERSLQGDLDGAVGQRPPTDDVVAGSGSSADGAPSKAVGDTGDSAGGAASGAASDTGDSAGGSGEAGAGAGSDAAA